MIKKWKQFNENKSEKPGSNIKGSTKMNLSDEDFNEFNDNISLKKLVSDDKVALIGNEVWYWENDKDTKDILNQYFNN